MQLSKRMQAVADMVTEGNTVVDVGTDHGYLPIYLVEEGKSPRAIAMDVKQGPLERAKENVSTHELMHLIELRLSDGLAAFTAGEAGEAATLIVAGMGGGLMTRILSENAEKTDSFSELVLEPQSDVQKVRYFLRTSGWMIIDENFVKEDDKYYPIIRAVRAEKRMGVASFEQDPQKVNYTLEDYYGPVLMKKRIPDFIRFLENEHRIYVEIIQKLDSSNAQRRSEVQMILMQNARALDRCRLAK